jgi:peptidyl-prolyl cis-trans isomerase D
MIQIFRKFIFSKIGAGVTVAFLVIIALAFAAGDVLNFGGGSTIQSSDEVAKVGSHKITAAEYEKAVVDAFNQEQQQNPRLTRAQFIAMGGGELVLNQLLDRAALIDFGRKHGIVAGDRLIDSEIAKLPIAQGADGRFSQQVYEHFLQQRGFTDKQVREDLTASLIARQLLVPASFGAKFPQDATLRYSSFLRERRKGAIALLPAQAFAPAAAPSEAEITAYYNKTRAAYTVPERRTLRYAFIDASVVKAVAAPTEAEIAARYNANKAAYAASETRKIVQLVVPTEAAARAVLAETAKGASLENAAKSKGLSTSALNLGKPALSSQTSQAVADAAYAAKAGTVVGPARSGLGWHLLRVDAVDSKPARTLDQVRGELTAQLTEAKRRQALSDFSARIEEEFDNGSALSDVAKELSLTPTVTEPLTADGKVFGKQGQSVPAELAKVVQAAFSMERQNQPQLAEIDPGKRFVVFDVTQITAAAPAPLAEVRPLVVTELQLEKGQAAAKVAAQRVLAATRQGKDLAAAVAQLGVAVPPVDQVDMPRSELTANGQQIPPPLALLFSMAQGTVKLYPAPRNRGWFLVGVTQIIPGAIPPNDPEVAQARKDLGQLAGREYAEELRRAIRAEVGVTRTDSAIKAALAQVTGGN